MEPRTFAGFLVAIAAVVVIAVLSYDSLRETHVRSESLARTVEVLAQIQGLVSTLKDAETGQRGYLLTGRESYLEPFLNAKRVLPDQFVNLRALLGDDPAQRTHLDTLQALANDKLNELMDTVQLRRAGQTEAAMALVLTDRGKNSMDRIRAIAAEMTRLERQLVGQRTQEWRRAATSAFWITSVGSLVLLLLIVVAAAMTSRDFKARQRESWLRAGQIGLSELMQGDLPLEQLGENVLRFLTHYLDAQVGALFVADGAVFRRVAGHALPAGDVAPMRPGDGLAGQSAKDNRLIRVRGVPPDYLPIGSGTGRSDAAELLISPAAIDQRVYAVIELGFFGSIGSGPEELLSRVSEPVAAAIRASRDRFRLEELLQETQQQAEELQTREEELRVNNEELEEQGRTLRESRAQLESQQAELEQINSQLEEQAQALEDQRDSLARSHATMASKSLELQRANEYKSEFLANMSHELRTPLNSTLILAKLLADNKEGNLTESQVKYAQTISSAGNDLLALINDVLDLSRIEAGRIDVMPETLSLAHAIEPLIKMFEPASGEKNLKFARGHRARRTQNHRDRSPKARPDSEESAVERVEVHSSGRDRPADLHRLARQRCPSRYTTPASASSRISMRSYSRRFARPTAAFTASSAAPASGSPSPGTWRACSAAASSSTAARAQAAPSRLPCRSSITAPAPAAERLTGTAQRCGEHDRERTLVQGARARGHGTHGPHARSRRHRRMTASI